MVSYVALVIVCIVVGAISSIATVIVMRNSVDGVLRVIAADYDDGTYLTLEAHKDVEAIAKQKSVHFIVRPEHYKSQE